MSQTNNDHIIHSVGVQQINPNEIIFDNESKYEDPTEIFEIEAKIGEGSYGCVFLGRDKRDDQRVAIKVLAVDNEDTTELQKEINILRSCKSEYIVAYKGSYEKDGEVWIVMEYCDCSLADLMTLCQITLTEEQIAVVMKMALHGLEYLHASKTIHRDIKAGNILSTKTGDCKLADFGVSAELVHTMSKRQTLIGTPYWMAPEVLQQSQYDTKADIWSLAITAIELAEMAPPHSSIHHLRAIFVIPKSDPPTLRQPSKWSESFNDFLRVCLVKDPAKRPTAIELFKHPFIAKSKDKSIIGKLVCECLPKIEQIKALEMKQQEEANTMRSQEGLDGDPNGSLSEELAQLHYSNTMLPGNDNNGGGDMVNPTKNTMLKSSSSITINNNNQNNNNQNNANKNIPSKNTIVKR